MKHLREVGDRVGRLLPLGDRLRVRRHG
jgi:hypothetical protein